MNYDLWGYINTGGLQMPSIKTEVSREAVFRVLANLVWHCNEHDQNKVWVGLIKQSSETNLGRSTCLLGRRALSQAGWLIDTGEKESYGAWVYRLDIPGYDKWLSDTNSQTTNSQTDNDELGLGTGTGNGLSTGTGNGTATGTGTGTGNGLSNSTGTGTNSQPKTKLKKSKWNKTHLKHQPTENTKELHTVTQQELDNAGEHQMTDKTTPEQYAYEANLQVLADQELAKARESAMAEVQKMMQGKFKPKNDNEEPF